MPISAANVSLRQLAVLVAVCEHGGFSAAADALHMTQSAVSQAIRSLELAMEAPLLLRTRDAARRARPVPSALGEIVLQHARAALQEVEHAVAAARAQQGPDAESLRVGSVRSIATHLVRPALEEFRRSVPHVAPTLWVGTTREVHRWLQDGVIDVALLAPVLRQPARSVAVPIMEDPWYVVLSVSDPLAQQRRLDVQALATRPYVMADSGCEPAIWDLFARGGTEPNVCGRAQSTDTLLAMVAAGVGVTLVPQLALASLESPLLHAVPLDPPATRTVTAVLTAGDAAPPAARALLDLLRSHVDGRGSRRRRVAPRETMSKLAEGASAIEPPPCAPKLLAEVQLQPPPAPRMRQA
jgi:DNA-binding transcriptional LysR family regulator